MLGLRTPELLICLVPLLLIVGFIYFTEMVKKGRQIEINRHKRIYDTALQKLREEPTNARFHEQALDAGRAYANACRENNGVTIFDEAALANDIRAVTANASKVDPTVSAVLPSSAVLPLDERIAALQKLRAAGMLSDEEFEQKRKDILDSI